MAELTSYSDFAQFSVPHQNGISYIASYAASKHNAIKQKRWDGSNYFDNHVAIVADRVARLAPHYFVDVAAGGHLHYDAIMTAYLHDVLEDTNTVETDLIDLVPAEIRVAVVAITKIENEEYDDYIERCCNNRIARIVKYFDVQHNLQSLGDSQKNVNKKRLYKMVLKYINKCEELYANYQERIVG